jgi:hypothetical protein
MVIFGQIYAATFVSATSSMNYFAITYDFVPISIGYTMSAAYSYDNDGANRKIQYIAGSATVNTNQSYVDLTEMIALNFSDTMYGTPLDVNSSGSTYAYTRKDFSPAPTVSSLRLSPVARFNFADDVVPSFGENTQFNLDWNWTRALNVFDEDGLDGDSELNFIFDTDAFELGKQNSKLTEDGTVVAYVNGTAITQYELDKAVNNFTYSLHVNNQGAIEDREMKNLILNKLIEEKLIIEHLTKQTPFAVTIQDIQTFDYLALYKDLLNNQDYIGIKSFNNAFGRIQSYAEGLGLSLEEYLEGSAVKIAQTEKIAHWKDSLQKASVNIRDEISVLFSSAEIIILD